MNKGTSFMYKWCNLSDSIFYGWCSTRRI